MSTKNTKKRFLTCKEKGEKVLAVLNGKKASVDVTEFINTLKFVISVLDDYTKSKDKERPVIPDEGVKTENLLKEYDELLVQLINSQRFLRFFTSNRVRKKLDQINSQLHKEASEVFIGLQDIKKKQSKKATRKTVKPSDLEKQTDCIKDEEGKLLWEGNFDQTLMVEWTQFIQALKKVVPVDEDAEKQLKYILDNSNTGYVSMYKFSDFLNGFGPLKLCVSKVQSVLNAEWFHGFLSSAEAERLLERQPPATFLIRFSKSKAGSFAIAYVDANQRNAVTHTLIICCPPSGFKIEEAYNTRARGRLFVSLHEVVEFYNYLLKIPFKSDLSRQSWFHGDLTTQEADEILVGEKDGTFLFRFSSKSGFLAVSYVSGPTIKHGLLEAVPGGYKFENNPPIYPTLQDVVNNLSDFLKFPLSVLTYNDTTKKNAHVLPPHLRSSNTSSDPFSHQQGPSEYVKFELPNGGIPTNPPRPASPSLNRNPAQTNPYASTKPMNTNPNSSPTSPPKRFSTTPPTNNYASVTGQPLFTTTEDFRMNSSNNSNPIQDPSEYSSMFDNNQSNGILTHHPPQEEPDYGEISSPKKPGESSTVSPQSEYGSMPIPNGNSTQSNGHSSIPPSEYSTLSVEEEQRIANSSNPGTPQASKYGKVPPKQTPNSRPQSVAMQPQSEYGSMPLPASNPQPAPPSSSDNYGRMPTPVTSTTAIPPSSSPVVSAPGSNYGQIPLSLPKANSGTNVVAPPLSTSPSSQSDQYGRMPTPMTNTMNSPKPQPANQTSANPGSHYGKLPNVPQTSSTPSNAVPINNGIPTKITAKQTTNPPPSSNYGQIPITSTPPRSSSPAPLNPGTSSPSPVRTAPRNGTLSNGSTPPNIGVTPTSANSNYGHISLINPPAKQPTTQPTIQPNKAPYSRVPAKNPTPGSPANSPQKITKNPSTDADYGALPTSSPQSQYGRMPLISPTSTPTNQPRSQLNSSNDPDYGALPSHSTNLGNHQLKASDVEDDYGGLPTNIGTPNPDEEYLDLPPQYH